MAYKSDKVIINSPSVIIQSGGGGGGSVIIGNWTILTPGPNFTHEAGETLMYRSIGPGLIQVSGTLRANAASSGGSTSELATLPASAAPDKEIKAVISRDIYTMRQLNISTTGVMSITGSVNAGSRVYIHALFSVGP